MNPFTMLKEDHKKVKALFKEYEDAGDRAFKKKGQIAEKVMYELEVHAQVEEELFYPKVKQNVDKEARHLVNEAYEEHHVVKMLIAELKALKPEDEAFDAKFKVLMENVKHHIKEEEHELFPEAKDSLDGMSEPLGEEMEGRKVELQEEIPRASL
ncbi:MAG TPA: hemerythrin domain-containing protein [bacterium]|nr:hemerythrin domain-containing protein [bacterium]